MSRPVKRLGEILIERGKLDGGSLDRALRLQQDSGERLGALLVTLGIVAPRDVAEALAVQLDLPLLDGTGYPELPILEERVSPRFLRDARALPVREDAAVGTKQQHRQELQGRGDADGRAGMVGEDGEQRSGDVLREGFMGRHRPPEPFAPRPPSACGPTG